MTEEDDFVEEWEPIEGFSRYLVSNRGEIQNYDTGRIMRTSINAQGIHKIGLISDQGGQGTRSVKTLVARAFVDGESELMNTVIQKDGDQSNLYSDNLAWRPRWFAVQYVKQFDKIGPWLLNREVMDEETGTYYPDMVEAAIDNGLLFDHILESMFDVQRGCYPTGKTFAYTE